jgi:hypothetical protein
MTRDELADLIRDYNYSSEAVVNHLTNLPGKKSHNDYDDDVFEMDMGSTKVAPPPGFAAKGPSSLAKHLDSHPAVPKKAITGGPTLDELAHHDGEELPDDVTPFDFSEPSPDDFVLGKQKQAFRKVKGWHAHPYPIYMLFPHAIIIFVGFLQTKCTSLSLIQKLTAGPFFLFFCR